MPGGDDGLFTLIFAEFVLSILALDSSRKTCGAPRVTLVSGFRRVIKGLSDGDFLLDREGRERFRAFIRTSSSNKAAAVSSSPGCLHLAPEGLPGPRVAVQVSPVPVPGLS